jgi:dolichol-phosphate mannosyltransferase
MLGSRIRDITAGFRVYDLETLRRVLHSEVASQGYCFQVELAWRIERAGVTVVEHPITFTERENGTSKMHAGIVLEALLRVTGWGLARPFTRPDRD